MRTFLKTFAAPLPLAVLCLDGCAWASSGRGEAGRPGGVRASLCGGFSGCGARASHGGGFSSRGPVAARGARKRRHYSCGTRESLFQGAGPLPGPGRPCSCLDSGFFTTEPPGKPWPGHVWKAWLVFCRMPLNWGIFWICTWRILVISFPCIWSLLHSSPGRPWPCASLHALSIPALTSSYISCSVKMVVHQVSPL